MAKLDRTHTMLLFVLVSAFALILPRVNSEVCNESLGNCGVDCGPRCLSVHPDGQGICDKLDKCWCFFQCQKLKKCDSSLGFYGADCRDDQCTSDCAAKFLPRGASDVSGYCFGLFPYITCNCAYKAVTC